MNVKHGTDSERSWKFGQSSRKIEAVIIIRVTSLYLTVSKEKKLELRWMKVDSRAVDLFDWRVWLEFLIWQIRECDKLLMKESYNV